MVSRSPSLKHFNFRLSSRTTKVLIGLSTITALTTIAVKSDEGMQRSAKLFARAAAPLVKYRFYDWYTSDWPIELRTAKFAKLHQQYAPVAVNTVMELQGFYIKLGQVVAGLDGQFPDEYVQAFKSCLNHCPSRDITQVMETIEQELGKPFSEVFAWIDPQPLGSASIGQVHKAKLAGNGQEVCIKVQHPTAERFFRVDVAASKALTAIAQPAQLPVYDEIEKNFQTEFDYTLEAQNLQEMRLAVESHSEFRHLIVVPKPLMYTKRVLIMEYLKGETLQYKQREMLKQLAQRENKTVEQLELEIKQKLERGEALGPAPPSDGVMTMYRVALRTRDYVRNTVCLTYNVAFGYLTGAPLQYEWTSLPLKSEAALDTLYSFFGYMLFHHGLFSSDPHGGNILQLDEGNKLGLIDMGQVKRLDMSTRLQFAKLVVALANDCNRPEDTEQIAKLWRECGYVTRNQMDLPAADCARYFFDRITKDVVEKYGGIELIAENLEKADKLIKLPDDFVMPMRLSLLLRFNAMGLGRGLDGLKHSRVTPSWKPYAEEFIRRNS
ncbi:hypothetical protein BASA81_002179 [Batrachochytrium salamandrivorans]|nr:hypothetical protein BASA81_002179 [Batrachochytrium salamandrivorans]